MSFDTGRLSPVSAASAVCRAVELDQARVRGDGVALLDEQDVARHHLRGGNALPRAAADHVRVRGRHAPQRGDRLLGARLLDVAHERVQQDHREDRDRLVRQRRVAFEQPQSSGDGGRHEQQDHQRFGELREKLLPRRDRLFRGELVPAVALEPRARLGFAQAALRVGAEGGKRLFRAHPVRLRYRARNRRHMKSTAKRIKMISAALPTAVDAAQTH